MIQEMHAVLCEAAWECPNRFNAGFLLGEYGRYESAEACKSGSTARVDAEFNLRQLVAGVDAGRLVYSPMVMGQCVADFKTAMCSQSRAFEAPQSCYNALNGQVAPGEACADDLECGAGNRCSRGEMSMTCYGVCEPADLCGSVTCSANQFCRNNMCETRVEVDGWCLNDVQCVDEATCVNGTCIARNSIPIGGNCVATESCAGGGVCENGMCRTLEFVGLDADCGGLPQGYVPCRAGLTCLASGVLIGTCQPLLEDGAFCEYSMQCEAGLRCDMSCEPALADGIACTSEMDCESRICGNSCQPLSVCEIPE